MLTKVIRNRGANIVVEAQAEILMLPNGDIGVWKRRMTERVKQETRKEAPTNKRPRWGHYGKPLRSTFTSSTRTRLTRGGGFIYSAIGSTAPHAWYVDQGTGIYNGSSPYVAKILPPWHHGEGSLYEATWRPAGPGGRRVRPIMIKGQKGQEFFDKGLRRAFRSLGDSRYRAIGGQISAAIKTFPEGLANFTGNTPADEGFKASLALWRTWRDEAWERGELGPRGRSRVSDSDLRLSMKASKERDTRVSNIAAYRYSIEAAQRRAREQVARIRAERARREEAEARRRARETKAQARDRISRGNVATKREVLAFLARIRTKYPNAALDQTRLADGTMLYQVRYTTGDGRRVIRRWAYGYGGQVNVT